MLFFSLQTSSQITITEDDMPGPGVEVPVSSKPEPGIEITGHSAAGEDIEWDFSMITKLEQNLVRYISPTSAEIQYICIAIFNNPMDPEHNSTVAKPGEGGGDPMGNIQITDVFEFYKLTEEIYSMTGRSSNVNGLPTCVRNNPVDTIYRLPLQYSDTIVSNSAFEINLPGVGYYGQTLERISVVDAWGTVHTPLGSFNTLRVKSTLHFIDTIYYDSYGFGAQFPHTETHYTWLSNDLQHPVFVVEEKGPNFGGTIAFWADTLDYTSFNEHHLSNAISVYPNPVEDEFVVMISEDIPLPVHIVISDFFGRKIKVIEITSHIQTIDSNFLKPGSVYYLQSKEILFVSKIIKL